MWIGQVSIKSLFSLSLWWETTT